MNPLLNTEKVAVGCLHILKRRASVIFPGSTRAHPSHLAVVGLTFGGPLRPEWIRVFPFSVPWDLWHFVVVPVLLDIEGSGGLPVGDWSQNAAWIKAKLEKKLVGYVSEGTP